MTDETDRDNASAAPDDGTSSGTPFVPPADFGVLVQMLSTQSLVALGFIPHPGSGKKEVQPVLARHFIDLLTVIETKTKNNLDREEQAFLDETLHHLRMLFIEVSKKS